MKHVVCAADVSSQLQHSKQKETITMTIMAQQEETLTPLSFIIKHWNIHAPHINLLHSHSALLEGFKRTTS